MLTNVSALVRIPTEALASIKIAKWQANPECFQDLTQLCLIIALPLLVVIKRETISICRRFLLLLVLVRSLLSPLLSKRRHGKKLIEHSKEKAGKQTMILLLSAPTAMTCYPKVGFTKKTGLLLSTEQNKILQ